MRRNPHTRLLVLFALCAPAYAGADDAIALSGSTRDVVARAAAAEPSSGDADEGFGSGDVVDAEERPSRERRRHGGGGDRRVATPGGASLERAQRLGLGTRDAAVDLLHQPPRTAWVTAAGRTRVRDLRWPVDEGGFGRGVGYVRTDRPEVPHNGVDIVAPRGSVIHAAADGIVAYSDNGLRGYGNCVIIVHANGWITLYGHADRTTVQAGWRVRRGERIGFVGSTGHSQGPHLHFELRVDGRPVDPLVHFKGQPWVTGRARLNVLRARPDGGHSREHLGALAPDFEPAPELAPARVTTAEARAEARRVEARIRRSEVDVERMAERARARETTRPVVTRVRDVPEERAREATAAPQRAREDEPPTPTRVRETPTARPARASAPETTPARSATTPEPRATRAPTPTPARAPAAAPAPAVSALGFPTTPPAEITALLESGPPVGMLAQVEGRTFTTLLFPLRDGEIVRGRTKLELHGEARSSMRAASDGRVVYVGHGIDGDALSVVIVHRDGAVTVYSGFDRVHVERGASVLRGAPLGTTRASGDATFELRVRGRRVDPRERFALAPGSATPARPSDER